MFKKKWISLDYLPTVVCLSAGLYFMYVFFQMSVLNEINIDLRKTFEINSVHIGYIANGFKLINILFLLPASVLLDNYSTKKIILTTFFVCLLATLGFSHAPNFQLAVLFYSIIGLGNAFCLAAGVILISRWFPENRRGFYVGILITMAFIGGALSQAPIAGIVAHFGWRTTISISAAIGFVMFLWIGYVVRDFPVSGEIAVKTEPCISSSRIKHVLFNPQNWLTGLYIGLMNMPVITLGSLWGRSYVENGLKFSDMIASDATACFFVGMILGCPTVGYLSDMIGKRRLLMSIGAILLAFIFIPFLTNVVLTKYAVMILFFMIGFLSAIQIIGYPLISEKNFKSDIGKATSIATFLVIFLGILGTGFFGRVLHYVAGEQAVFYSKHDYHYALFLFPVTALLAALISFFIHDHRVVTDPKKRS